MNIRPCEECRGCEGLVLHANHKNGTVCLVCETCGAMTEWNLSSERAIGDWNAGNLYEWKDRNKSV